MNKEFVPYELAVKLKELGFDEPCISYYTVYGKFSNDYSAPRKYNSEFELGSYISAPTFSQAFRWFREKYDLFGCIDLHVSNPIHWFIRIDKIEINDYLFHSEDENIYFTTYEEAELACLDKMIEIVETKQQEKEDGTK